LKWTAAQLAPQVKQQPGREMVVGGANLVATFARYGPIDEYRIYPQTVVLGAGHPLFPPSQTRLSLRHRHAPLRQWPRPAELRAG
jgi:dihydrofolate reductase